jgi:uncharacterized protein YijF (DUF1287 family)
MTSATRRRFLAALPAAFAARGAGSQDHSRRLVEAARDQTRQSVTYDGSYRRIGYPAGDVPAHIGVCTDLVVRAYRRLNIDLQVLVHEDMARHFEVYPRQWGMKAPDTNIDHRRVPNLRVFFTRKGRALNFDSDQRRYAAGDMVTWRLPGNLPHIGIVSDRRTMLAARPLIIHNIGAGPVEDDILFAYPITGRYRYPA